MSYLHNLHWTALSIIALFCLIPVTLMYPMLQKHFGTGTPVAFVWYAWSFSVWAPLLCCGSGVVNQSNALPTTKVIAIVVFVAACSTIGTFSLFSAAPKAPNPGLPFVIVTGSPIIAYFASGLLAPLLPRIFPPARIDAPNLVGLALIITGVVVITLRK